MRFELNHLKYFYYTVLEGSITAAAKYLHVQQPVVSKMIKVLEEDLDKKLFVTIGRKKELTDFGQKIFRHCDKIFSEFNSISSLCGKEEEIPGTIIFSGAEHLLKLLVDGIKSDPFNTFQNTSYVFNSVSYDKMIDQLQTGESHLGICLFDPYIPEDISIFKKIPLVHNLVISKKYRKSLATLNTFIGAREVENRNSKKFPALEYHQNKYPKCEIKYSSNSLTLHKDLVRSGFGISILPNFLVKEEIKSGEFVTLYPKEKFVWNLKLLVSNKKPVPNFIQDLCSSL
jgi:DNA-binding transcriptional LysR family regulator